MRRISLLLFLLPLHLIAQSSLQQAEDSLKVWGPRMFKGTDAQKEIAVAHFEKLLTETLQREDSWGYGFDSLRFMARLQPPDKKFKLYNWHFPKDDGTYVYYGIIQQYDPKTKQISLTKLNDQSDDIRNAETSQLSPEKWYGALYYSLIQTSDKKKTYYTLLGWDGNNKVSWKKIIDVITFDGSGKPVFGDNIFITSSKRNKSRVIFEFKAEMVMVLRYDEQQKMIVYDKLIPEFENMKNPPPQFLVNSFEYYGMKFSKGKWISEEARPNNRKNRADKVYHDPAKDKATPSAVPEAEEKKGFFYRLFHKKKTAAIAPNLPT